MVLLNSNMEMMIMKLVFPSLLYKEKAKQFINEFYEYNSDINGSGGLDGYLVNSTYEEWI